MRSLLFALCALVLLATPSTARADGNYVYLRTNPLAFAVHGTPMSPQPGGARSVWYPDLFGLGFNYRKWDVSFHMTGQNVSPHTGEFSVLYGRLSAAVRPLKSGQLSFVDPYAFAGAGFGGAGVYGKVDPDCVATPSQNCAEGRSGWGGGAHAGLGVDFNIPIATIKSSGQRISAFVGLELRAELFYASGLNLFTVYSVPIGVRLD